MNKKLKPKEQLDLEIEQVSKTLTEGYDFFNYIRGFDFGVKDVLSSINVEKYDEITKDYDGLQFYLAFKKRTEIIHNIEYANHLSNETYAEYLEYYKCQSLQYIAKSQPLSEEEYEHEKSESIKKELHLTSEFIEEIFYGNALLITHKDMVHIRHWSLRGSVLTIDMVDIANRNRHNGFMGGGMGNKKFNQIISNAILDDTYTTSYDDIDEIPRGYGWESDGFDGTNKNTIWAEIDLSLPDDILIDGFKQWLSDVRERHADIFGKESENEWKKNTFKLSLLKRWKNLRVLAYLDMKILSDFFNQQPKFKEYGDALYFDEYDVDTTEKVRKTLLPLVQNIFNGSCLEHLLSKALAEGKVPK